MALLSRFLQTFIVLGMYNFGPGCHNNEPIFSFPIYPIGITIWRSAASASAKDCCCQCLVQGENSDDCSTLFIFRKRWVVFNVAAAATAGAATALRYWATVCSEFKRSQSFSQQLGALLVLCTTVVITKEDTLLVLYEEEMR